MSAWARACQLDFDLLKDVEPVAQLPNNPLLIVARKAGTGEQGVDRLAESQPGQGIVGTSGVGGAHRGRVLLAAPGPLPIRTLSWCGCGRAHRFEFPTRALRERHIRVARKQELKDRIMATVYYFNQEVVVHIWPMSLIRVSDMI